MSELDALAAQATWTADNIAFNLKFVPDDKLDWKPAPTAKSVLEVINHTVAAMKGMSGAIRGGSWEVPAFDPATTNEQAQSMIRDAVADYTAALKSLSPADLEKSVTLPFGTFSLRQFTGFGVVELQHHRGQIAYLQTLWGDTQDHFDM